MVGTAGQQPEYPSGQRGRTQDALRNASQVRILSPAPSIANRLIEHVFFKSNGLEIHH